MASTELIKGTLQTIILKVLHDNGRMYGYEITQKVKKLTDGEIQLSEGSLYPHLHRMEAEGILTTETIHIGKRVRKYYRITASGKMVVDEKIRDFTNFVRIMQNVLQLNPISNA
ncbi:MAG: helix-turn-helix transcriptional regulator [Bacteroidetes bacterium]|nr:helix-turn-helix transcriptional regulator [Bacteroidota bacterium]